MTESGSRRRAFAVPVHLLGKFQHVGIYETNSVALELQVPAMVTGNGVWALIELIRELCQRCATPSHNMRRVRVESSKRECC